VREQLTPDGIALLVGAILFFWLAVATLVRLHRRHGRHGRQGREDRENRHGHGHARAAAAAAPRAGGPHGQP
jgi:hypothetical protein